MPRNPTRRYVTDAEFAISLVKPGRPWTFNKGTKGYRRPKFRFPLESGLHPTQKSVGLMAELIKIHTNAGNVILDAFMGSGTTGVAAKGLGRSFIGIEQDAKMFEVAKNRINA